MKPKSCLLGVVMIHLAFASFAVAEEPTYAERLGWGPEDRVVIFHIDDTGMSLGSNLGTIKAMEEGLANSCSIMMPCPWVSGYWRHLKEHPDTCAGLHLTLTSEWDNYRWGPVAGKAQVPSLVDEEGCLWGSVEEVVKHGTPDDVETEIRAQIERALKMGIKPSHLDSHMGTLFASIAFIERYVKVGIEYGIPILMPGGHLQFIGREDEVPAEVARALGKKLWDAGMPVIDDVVAETYGWKRGDKVETFSKFLREMQPGITEFIVHCSVPTEEFPAFTGSSETRLGDLEAMLDERLKKVIEEEGIILTTWRELSERRKQVDQ
jgi:chitin disaccharide deacetylase